MNVLSGHLISRCGSFGVTDELTETVMQRVFRPVIPIPDFLASYILGALAENTSSSISPTTLLRAVMAACGSLSDVVNNSINLTFSWDEECECVLQYLLAASGAVTTGFGVEISQGSDVNMSDDLSSCVAAIYPSFPILSSRPIDKPQPPLHVTFSL